MLGLKGGNVSSIGINNLGVNNLGIEIFLSVQNYPFYI